MSGRGFTRRQILGAGLTLGAGAALGGCATGGVRTTPRQELLELGFAERPGRVAISLEKEKGAREAAEAVVALAGGLDWLSKGDRVFVKVACNSGNEHPAVTAPEAVEAVVAMLKDRGAGRILVGDQAGVEHVRLTAEGRRSSTRELMQENGLLAAIERSGAEFFAFDDQGWDGYFQAQADFPTSWGGEAWLPKVLEQVDHVVYLPRLGTHAVAGYTCGIKCAVGWLRDDSRRALHASGPEFYDRIADLNHFEPLRKRLRLVLTVGRKALLNVGPDMGSAYDFGGLLSLASTSLVDHDALAASLLPWLDGDDTSFFDIYAPYPEHVNYWNSGFVEDTWGEEALKSYRELVPPALGKGIEYDACVSRLAQLQGYRPRRIEVVGAPAGLPEDLLAHVRSFGDGLFVL